MKKSTLKKIIPSFREYVKGRGNNPDQLFDVHQWHNNAHAAVVYANGTMLRSQKSESFCYGSFNRSYYDRGNQPDVKPEAVLVQIQPKQKATSDEAFSHYIEWVLNYSPWRHIFVTKNTARALRDGVVVVDPTIRARTMLDGMIALRMAWEDYGRYARYHQIDFWWELTQKLDPKLSFALSNSVFDFYGQGKTYQTVTLSHAYHGHDPIQFAADNVDYDGDDVETIARYKLDNFLLENIVDDSKPWADQRKCNGATSIWQGKRTQLDLYESVSQLLKDMAKKKAGNNPFARNGSYVTEYNRNEVVDCLQQSLPSMEGMLYAEQ